MGRVGSGEADEEVGEEGVEIGVENRPDSENIPPRYRAPAKLSETFSIEREIGMVRNFTGVSFYTLR